MIECGSPECCKCVEACDPEDPDNCDCADVCLPKGESIT